MGYKPSEGPQGKKYLGLYSQSFQPVSRFSPAQPDAWPGQIESRMQRPLMPKMKELSPAVASRRSVAQDCALLETPKICPQAARRCSASSLCGLARAGAASVAAPERPEVTLPPSAQPTANLFGADVRKPLLRDFHRPLQFPEAGVALLKTDLRNVNWNALLRTTHA
jgi:hypothetical protein